MGIDSDSIVYWSFSGICCVVGNMKCFETFVLMIREPTSPPGSIFKKNPQMWLCSNFSFCSKNVWPKSGVVQPPASSARTPSGMTTYVSDQTFLYLVFILHNSPVIWAFVLFKNPTNSHQTMVVIMIAFEI